MVVLGKKEHPHLSFTDSFLLERLQRAQDTELRMADQVHALTELSFLFLQGEAIKAESSASNKGTAEEGCSPRHQDPTLIPIAGTWSGAGFKSSPWNTFCSCNTQNTICVPVTEGEETYLLLFWTWNPGG